MLQNAYFIAKIGADTAEIEQHFAEILPTGRRVADPAWAEAAAASGYSATDCPPQRGASAQSSKSTYFGTYAFHHSFIKITKWATLDGSLTAAPKQNWASKSAQTL